LYGEGTVFLKDTCQNLFALWKDADPDIPILKQAKAEFAKLRRPALIVLPSLPSRVP
jgi:hypothetical protein